MSESKEREENISVIIRIKAKMPDEFDTKYTSMKVTKSNTISLISKKKIFIMIILGMKNQHKKIYLSIVVKKYAIIL